jgi:hypothetical protein
MFIKALIHKIAHMLGFEIFEHQMEDLVPWDTLHRHRMCIMCGYKPEHVARMK